MAGLIARSKKGSEEVLQGEPDNPEVKDLSLSLCTYAPSSLFISISFLGKEKLKNSSSFTGEDPNCNLQVTDLGLLTFKPLYYAIVLRSFLRKVTE